jgi:SagB-type dehydrogenase family enzyme
MNRSHDTIEPPQGESMTAREVKAVQYSVVSIFDRDDHSIAETFHETTKLNRENIGLLSKRVGMIVRDPKIRTMMSRSWKTYRGQPTVPLPPVNLGAMSLADALDGRESISSRAGGAFSGKPLTLEQLGSVLGGSYGLTRGMPIGGTGETQHFRPVTSAGGLYPLEIYPLIFNVDGLAEGVYHYHPRDHSLETVRPGPCLADFLSLTTYGDMCRNAGVIFVVTSVFHRNMSKYLHRGYRFVLNDAGALLQTLYLTGTALGLGTCALGGFFDDELGNLLGINNVDEAPIICFLLGEKK